MHVHFLTDSAQRAHGAMFSRSLEENLLVFLYPLATSHTFHTFFCPTLRLIALGEAGQALFDQLIPPNRFVRLPPSKVILECAPEAEYRSQVETILSVAQSRQPRQAGAWDPNASLDSLLFALFAQAMSDLRRVRSASPEGVSLAGLRQRFNQWERGRFASSAGFVMDFPELYRLPESAVELCQELIQVEEPHLDELLAAAIGGMPWRNVFPGICIRCGEAAHWKTALTAPPWTPPEINWRYQRPENAVPLCHACTMTLEFLKKPTLRIDLAWGLWGPRFEAFWRWHQALAQNQLPRWDKLAEPLWPAEFGGETWETGSGALEHATPRSPHGVARTAQHDEIFWRALTVKDMRKRHLTDAHLLRLLAFPAEQGAR